VRFLLDHDVPDDIVFTLDTLGHEVARLRDVMPATITDESVLELARALDDVLITCNRDDFLALAEQSPHPGIIVLIRRRSRALERAALVGLLDKAGESGIRRNVNFA
jgi:predicted nuclease of predicted toxin-antitoxin system